MNQQSPVRSGTAALTLAALGVVYGDIGTSPLYAFKEAFSGPHAMALNQQNVLAALSALFWAVTCIISVKYVWLVLRFDNDGEGGVLALTALTHRLGEHRKASARALAIIATLGVFAAALFYGDALITPAISVLSAVEGLGVATPHFEKYVVPITIGVLIALFSIQRFGTGRVGALFGPITCVWFIAIGVLGLQSIIETPVVLQALNPMYAVNFAIEYPGKMFVLLAAVFLALTGHAPFAGATHMETLRALINQDPRPLREWNASVPPALEAVILKGLRKRREDRFSRAGEMAEALRPFGLAGTGAEETRALPTAAPDASRPSAIRDLPSDTCPMVAALGIRPTPSVDNPITISVTTNVRLRPIRSPKCPNTAPPTGRATNAEANAPSDATVAMVGPRCGKKTFGNTSAAAVP